MKLLFIFPILAATLATATLIGTKRFRPAVLKESSTTTTTTVAATTFETSPRTTTASGRLSSAHDTTTTEATTTFQAFFEVRNLFIHFKSSVSKTNSCILACPSLHSRRTRWLQARGCQ